MVKSTKKMQCAKRALCKEEGKLLSLNYSFNDNVIKCPYNDDVTVNFYFQYRAKYLSRKGLLKWVSLEFFLNEQLQDPEVKKEYDALEAEYSIKQAIIDARNTANMSQQELSQRTGIAHLQ